MSTFTLTNKAVADLSEIWNYTYDTWSEQQADNYYKLIIQACSIVAKNPKLGKYYHEIYPNLLGKKASKHIIFYLAQEDKSIEVVRVLHESMDLKGNWNFVV
jgi:toxin ParE1/3/4